MIFRPTGGQGSSVARRSRTAVVCVTAARLRRIGNRSGGRSQERRRRRTESRLATPSAVKMAARPNKPVRELAGTGFSSARHRPAAPGWLHDWPGLEHGPLQQTPSTQNVDAHSVPLPQAKPRPRGVGVVVGVGVSVEVAVTVGVWVTVGVSVGVAVVVGVGVSVGVAVGVGVSVGVAVGVSVGVSVGVAVGVSVGVVVGVAVSVGVGVGGGLHTLSGTLLLGLHVPPTTRLPQFVGGPLGQLAVVFPSQ